MFIFLKFIYGTIGFGIHQFCESLVSFQYLKQNPTKMKK